MRVLSLAFALTLMTSMSALAAPFCMTINGTAPQCIYYDGAQCQHDAQRQNGACEANPAIKVPTSRIGGFCVVLVNGQSTCGYADGALCSTDAIQQKGACVRAAQAGPRTIPDQYDPNANR